ncbi:hypothetical protein ABIC85_001815 [Oerskovia enterophila]
MPDSPADAAMISDIRTDSVREVGKRIMAEGSELSGVVSAAGPA